MILITGATGMLGAHLVAGLVGRGQRVCALRRAESNTHTFCAIMAHCGLARSDWEPFVEWREADLADYPALLDALKGISNVYHTAARVSFQPQDRVSVLNTNVKGTANLVNACLETGVERLLHVSSIAALGDSFNGELIDEATPRDNERRRSAYSLSKYLSELEVWRAGVEGLNIVIINPSVILGVGDWAKGSPALVALGRRGLKFYTSGSTGYVDVLDVVEIAIRLMESDIRSERFVLNAENLDYRTFFGMLASQFGLAPPAIRVNRFMALLAVLAARLGFLLAGRPMRITSETMRIAREKTAYSSKKLENALGAYAFRSVKQTLARICQALEA